LVLIRKRDAAASDPPVDAENGALQDKVVHASKDGVAVADHVANIGDAARLAELS